MPPKPAETARERANRALVIVLQSRPFLRLRNAFKNSAFEASKLVSTKALLLKHYYCRQGQHVNGEKCMVATMPPELTTPGQGGARMILAWELLHEGPCYPGPDAATDATAAELWSSLWPTAARPEEKGQKERAQTPIVCFGQVLPKCLSRSHLLSILLGDDGQNGLEVRLGGQMAMWSSSSSGREAKSAWSLAEKNRRASFWVLHQLVSVFGDDIILMFLSHVLCLSLSPFFGGSQQQSVLRSEPCSSWWQCGALCDCRSNLAILFGWQRGIRHQHEAILAWLTSDGSPPRRSEC